jgi:hypothetical protein
LHNGRQLLVVTDEDEAVDAIAGKQPYQSRLQYLRRLVDVSQREVFQLEDERPGLQHRRGAHDDGHGLDTLSDGIKLGLLAEHVFQQVACKAWVARGVVAYPYVVEPCILQHGTDFVDGPVGVRE